MSEPTQQQKRAGLARARGWTVKREKGRYVAEADCWYTPEGNFHPWGCPNPYESAADKDALVAWLAADGALWKQFRREILMEWTSSAEQDVVRFMLTAPLSVIADAAWLAITSAEQPKAS